MLTVRDARKSDTAVIHELIGELADFEQLRDQFNGSVSDLERHLFGAEPYARVIMAESEGQVAGFALYFFNYSTFLCKPGIYLEDLFVRPQFRGAGVGRALLEAVEQRARDRGCGRLEWAVLDWNTRAMRFYEEFGAGPRGGWTVYRKLLTAPA
jgi:GNAT superfamily N-acetyltransferase